VKNTEDIEIRNLVKNLYESSEDSLYSIAITGGGVKAVDWLLSVPGASSRILEVVVPYSIPSLRKYLGKSIEKSVSLDTALLLADKAYGEAKQKHPDKKNFVGIGVTASLDTNRFKRSRNQFYMVAKSDEKLLGYSVIFNKGFRDRNSEDKITSKAILALMYEVVGLKNHIEMDLYEEDKFIRYSKLEFMTQELFQGKKDYIFVDRSGLASYYLDFSGILIPGSFNPLHHGHIGMMKSGLKVLKDSQVLFELSISNVDKPDLDKKELMRRIKQFKGLSGIIITRSPKFVEKSRLFPGCKFIVGIDTMERIVDQKYYQSEEDLSDSISELKRLGIQFLVVGRSDSVGKFKSLTDIQIDKSVKSLVVEISESDFRIDISSRDLR